MTKKQEKSLLEHFSASPLRAKKLQRDHDIIPINYPVIYLSSEMLLAASLAKGRANQRKWAFDFCYHRSRKFALARESGKQHQETIQFFFDRGGFTLELQLFGEIITCPKYQIRVMPTTTNNYF